MDTMINPQVDKDGNKEWYNENGQFHRDDGPAIEWADGSKTWYQNGKVHREDGPAMTWDDGQKFWFIKGKNIQ
jgi:hypothetical protein